MGQLMIAVFDTNIVIDALNGVTEADTILVTRNTKDFGPDWEGIYLPYTL